MAKKSPKKKKHAPPANPAPAAEPKKTLPPDAVKRAIIFYRDNREIERNI